MLEAALCSVFCPYHMAQRRCCLELGFFSSEGRLGIGCLEAPIFYAALQREGALKVVDSRYRNNAPNSCKIEFWTGELALFPTVFLSVLAVKRKKAY